MNFGLRRDRVVAESMDHIQNWEEIKPVLEEYARSLNLDISVSNPHGLVSPPQVREGSLFVRFWSTPQGKGREAQVFGLRRAYGVPLGGGQTDGIRPSDDAQFTITDPDGVPVAQVFGDTLYVLFDLPHGDNAGILMRLIMGDFAKIARKMTPAERKAFEKEMNARAFDSLVFSMVESRTRRVKERIERDKAQLGEYERAYEMRKGELLKLFKRRKELGEQLKESEATRATFTAEEMKERLEKLQEIAQTNGYTLSVGRDEIRIGVGQIDLEYEGRVYEIGDFEILLYNQGGGNGWWVRCINRNGATTTHQRDGEPVQLYHPHVKTNGHCCFGNIEEGVRRMAEDMDLVPLTLVVVEFLKSVNRGGWYGSVESWPKKKQQKKPEERRR